MRLLSVRLIVSLILGVTLVSLLSSYYEVQGEKRGLRKELEHRADVLGESLAGNVEPHLESGSLKELQRIVERFSNREHLAGVAVFNTKLETSAESSGLAQRLQMQPAVHKRFDERLVLAEHAHLVGGRGRILGPDERSEQDADRR